MEDWIGRPNVECIGGPWDGREIIFPDNEDIPPVLTLPRHPEGVYVYDVSIADGHCAYCWCPPGTKPIG